MSKTKIGMIANINHQYVILNDKRHIEFTSILKFLLPNDIVEYNENKEGKLVITRLKERKPQYLFAIVTNTDEQYAYLYSNHLPKWFCPYVPLETNKVGDRVIIFCSIKGIEIYKKMGLTKDRTKDTELFLELYRLNSFSIETPIYKKVRNAYYTKPFQDLTHLDTFNVDPVQSTDFDDAVSIDPSDPSKIFVHIVDASSIFTDPVKEQEAFFKAFTFYLPDHVEHMIGEYQNYSLIKDQKRNVITIEYTIDDEQNIKSYDIYPSSIIIKKRYNYEEFLSDLPNYPTLVQFNEKWNQKTLNIPHLKLHLDNEGKLENYFHESNTDISHKIIETLMIMTNSTISRHIDDLPQRFHTKVKTYNENINLTENDIVNSILTIKKYKNAIYSDTEKGHSGLGLITYTHFTSPIRRYFDVIVHKMLEGYELVNKEVILNYINEKERMIDIYTKCYSQLKLLDYFDRHKNNVYQAYIINKTEKGVVVFLSDVLYESFIFTQVDFVVGSKKNIKITQIL